jgi:hypothetical protein
MVLARTSARTGVAAPPPLPRCAAAPFVEEPDTGAKFTGSHLSYGSSKMAARGTWAAMGIHPGGQRAAARHLEGAGAPGVAAGAALVHAGFHGPAADYKDNHRFAYVHDDTVAHLEQDNGVHCGRGNDGLALAGSCAKDEAVQAGLATAHVLALRLYTSNSSWQINTPFCRGCSAAGTDEQPRTFWRGMSGARVTQEFMEQFTRGTEMAPMSTSDDEAVARHSAKWDDAACTDAGLPKVEATDHTCCGADPAWLSMCAGEREVLFPPLAYLEYVGHEQLRPGRTVITARPSFSCRGCNNAAAVAHAAAAAMAATAALPWRP